MRILLIEDDQMLGAALKAGLSQDGHAVDWVRTTNEARAVWLSIEKDQVPYAAAIVDLGLPDGNGLDLIRSARRRGERTVIIAVTARGQVADRIAGLEAGADDYMVKPVDLDELSARLLASERRVTGGVTTVSPFGPLEIHAADRRVTLHGRQIDLTAQEFAVLIAVSRSPGAIVSRQRIEESLYEWDQSAESNIVEVQIYRLRKKLGRNSIENHRGLGYRLVAPE